MQFVSLEFRYLFRRRWKSVGNVMSVEIESKPIETNRLFVSSKRPAFFDKLKGYNSQATVRVLGVNAAYLDMREMLNNRIKVEWRISYLEKGYCFVGYVTSAIDSLNDAGVIESNYVISGFNRIMVKKYGSTSKKRDDSIQDIRKVCRGKSKGPSKDALGSKRNRKRVRKADLVQLSMGRKKRVRGKDVAVVRDRNVGRKPSDSKLNVRRGRGKAVRS